ncbi:MAG: MarR family transcriptional regulator [Solirubrobacteraceae bacterium]|nr:MarR family transcriptional regulator [Solirubrobacteraceae bacterium]
MSPAEPEHDAIAREVWLHLSDLVLDNTRRRAVSDALGMPFGRTRGLRRLARRPMTMREFADAMDIDPPNATAVVDQLEQAGLAERKPHPTDRRVKLVDLTPEGRRLADEANDILSTPPAGLSALSADELAELARLLAKTTETG